VLTQAYELEKNGLEVIDLANDEEFSARKLHSHNAIAQLAGIKRIARALWMILSISSRF
jgi:hypothetical protein